MSDFEFQSPHSYAITKNQTAFSFSGISDFTDLKNTKLFALKQKNGVRMLFARAIRGGGKQARDSFSLTKPCSENP